ncbi:MAG: BlaI/MecI/CopY family transcriptional regulator [Lactobacillaceae bacterium]
MEKLKFTKRELDIMHVLWDAKEPLSAKEVFQQNSSISLNTIQAVLRKLLRNKIIKTAEIGYSGTVLTRKYSPLLSEEDYLASQFSKKSISNLISLLIKNSKAEDLDKIEKLVKDKKAELTVNN